MSFFKKHRLAVITAVYWLLLGYMVAALFFWFIELYDQNKRMADLRLVELKKDDPEYISRRENITGYQKLKTAQYIGEGATFLVVILIGAVFVSRAIRRQLRLSNQQQNFMMAITHELKTPIAITRLNLETLQKRKLDAAQQQNLISHTLQEANRLNTLCNNILLASQLDAGAHKPVKEEIHFNDLVEGCIEDFRLRYPQRKIDTDIDESIYLNGEELLLQMLTNNLVENALKYSPVDSAIQVTLKENTKAVILQVMDQGAGIADEEKKKVFQKFYRTGDENTRKAKGTGLGLYLCKKIMEEHNGSVSVTDNQPKGSIFTATFNL